MWFRRSVDSVAYCGRLRRPGHCPLPGVIGLRQVDEIARFTAVGE